MREEPSEEELAALLAHLSPDPEPDSWDEATDGERLRWLKRVHRFLDLPDEQREVLRRLPYWHALGPEDGLPGEWFNPRGYLLPVYRPGGGRHAEYRAARRLMRLCQPAIEWAEVRWHEIDHLLKLWLGVGGFFLAMAGAIWVQAVSRLEGPWNILLSMALFPLVWLECTALRSFARRSYYRCAGRKTRRRLGLDPDSNAADLSALSRRRPRSP